MALADQAHFGNYSPANFGWGGALDPESHPAMLVPFSFDGVSFGQTHRDAAPVFRALLTELVPHIVGGLHAGSCWSFSTTDNLPDGSRSFHSYGTAIDVNWNVNHMGTNIADAQGRYAIPRSVATALARKYGCEWGGNWSGGYHDLMHFEVHLSPAAARTVQLPTAADPLEEIMSYYPNKAAFEAAMAAIADHAVDRRMESAAGVGHGIPAWLQAYLFNSDLYKDPVGSKSHPKVDLPTLAAEVAAIKKKLGA